METSLLSFSLGIRAKEVKLRKVNLARNFMADQSHTHQEVEQQIREQCLSKLVKTREQVREQRRRNLFNCASSSAPKEKA